MTDKLIQAAIDTVAHNILLEKELITERAHADKWRELAERYDDIRYALRNTPDTPKGHTEFYHQCAQIIFDDES